MLSVQPFAGDAREWDGLTTGVTGWTQFHLFGWKGVIERVFGHECIYLGCRSGDNELRGVLPLVRVRSRLFGHYLVSMPFLNYGGPLGDADAVGVLARHATELADQGGVDLLEFRCREECPIDLPASHRKVTVLLDLPEGDTDSLWKALPAKVRSQVRRPRKAGVSIRFGLDQLEPFYEVFARHMRDLGTPVQPRRLFEAIAEAFPQDVWFGCAYLGGKHVAGGCGFRWAHEFEMTWASALRKHSRIAPNMLLYWSFMERCVAEGITTFNFGRCTPGGGTHRFKRQWGGRDEELWWYQHGPRRGGGTPSPESPAYSWGPRVWRRLPVAVANVVGPSVVRYIP